MYQSGASQYQKVNVTSEVLDADPHRLIQAVNALRCGGVGGERVEHQGLGIPAHLLEVRIYAHGRSSAEYQGNGGPDGAGAVGT